MTDKVFVYEFSACLGVCAKTVHELLPRVVEGWMAVMSNEF